MTNMKTEKTSNLNAIEHTWVPLLLFLLVLNLVQTIFSFEMGMNGITDGAFIVSAISLGLLSLALWKKTPGLLWGSIAMYAAQLIYLFFIRY